MNVCLWLCDISVHSAAPALASSCLRAQKKLLAWGSGISTSPTAIQNATNQQLVMEIYDHTHELLRCVAAGAGETRRWRWFTDVKQHILRMKPSVIQTFSVTLIHSWPVFSLLPASCPSIVTSPSLHPSMDWCLFLPPPWAIPLEGLCCEKSLLHSQPRGGATCRPTTCCLATPQTAPPTSPFFKKVGACHRDKDHSPDNNLSLSYLSEVGDTCLRPGDERWCRTHLWEQHNDCGAF